MKFLLASSCGQFFDVPNLVVTLDIEEGLSVLGLVAIEDVEDQVDFSWGEICGVLDVHLSVVKIQSAPLIVGEAITQIFVLLLDKTTGVDSSDTILLPIRVIISWKYSS